MKNSIAQLLLAAAAVSLVGCAAPRPPISLAVPFDEAATAEALQEGQNTIRGSALMRQQGGGVVTCAGFPVQMFPATQYARARMTAIYGSELGGFIRPSQSQTFVPNPSAYQTLARKTQCDAQGFFKFDKLKDGDFYVIAPVVWIIGGATQGGMLSTLVRVKDGEPKEIVLAH